MENSYIFSPLCVVFEWFGAMYYKCIIKHLPLIMNRNFIKTSAALFPGLRLFTLFCITSVVASFFTQQSQR